MRFGVADYLDYVAEPFDAIVTDGVLHLIPGDTATLVRKLAERPGSGRSSSSAACPSIAPTTGHSPCVRRVLRTVRSSWLDRLILTVARLVHGGEMDDESLRERVDYMYIAPERMMNKPLLECFASAGLRGAGHVPDDQHQPFAAETPGDGIRARAGQELMLKATTKARRHEENQRIFRVFVSSWLHLFCERCVQTS